MKCKKLFEKLFLYNVDYIEFSLNRELNITTKIKNIQIKILKNKKTRSILFE